MDLKIKDVAELLNVSETTIRRWLAEGKIPAYRIHHQYRFSRIEIENWVMSCRLSQTGSSFLPTEEKLLPQEVEEAAGVQNIQQFSLYRAIYRGDVVLTTTSSVKEELIREVVEGVVSNILPIDAEMLTELLIDRENLMPTALTHGIAVPHTREFLLKGPFDVTVVVFPEEPIDWGALDGQLVHTLFFLFAADDKRHLHLLAKIAHLSSNEEALAFMQSRPSKKELLEYIKNWEANLSASKQVVLA